MTRAQRWALLATAVILALVAFGSGSLRGGRLGDVRTDRYGAALDDSARLDATISQGAGTLRVETIDSDRAYEATITHHAGIRIRADYSRGRLIISDDRGRVRGRRITNDWTVAITRRVPVDLTASTGAGRGTFDLTGLRGRARIRAGAGEVRVEFRDGPAELEELVLQAGAGRFDAVGLGSAHARRIEARAGVGEFRLDFAGSAEGVTQVEVQGGVGKILVTVPEGLGVRVFARSGMTSRLNLAGFTPHGDNEYVNAAWETAPAKVEIRASLGVGEFEVRGR